MVTNQCYQCSHSSYTMWITEYIITCNACSTKLKFKTLCGTCKFKTHLKPVWSAGLLHSCYSSQQTNNARSVFGISSKTKRNKTENATSGALSLKPNPRYSRTGLELIDGFCTLLWFKLAKTFGCDIGAVKRGNEQKNLTSSRAISYTSMYVSSDTPFSLCRSRLQSVPRSPIFFAHIEPLRQKEEIARSREAPLLCFACMMPFAGDKQNAMKEQNCSHAGIGKTMVGRRLASRWMRITWVKSINRGKQYQFISTVYLKLYLVKNTKNVSRRTK